MENMLKRNTTHPVINIDKLRHLIRAECLTSVTHNTGDHPMQPNELGIKHEDGKWKLYQAFEKGGFNVYAEYESESTACQDFLNSLRIRKRGQEAYERKMAKNSATNSP
jgi:hypothetical protein